MTSINYPVGFSGNWSGGTIAAASSQPVTVTFAPTAAISYGGTVTVNADQSSGLNTIAASGTGTVAPTREGLAEPMDVLTELSQNPKAVR